MHQDLKNLLMKPMDLSNVESEPSAIKYCLFSACAACCTAVFAVIGISLVTQKRFHDFSHKLTIVGIFFLSLALLSSVMAVVFKRIYKYHYDRKIITRSIRRQVNRDVNIEETGDL
jgi:hypothetical protein